MSGSKLARQLRRELTGNRKKAVILGLLGLVAIYFWAPLIWGWVVKEEPTDQPVSLGPAADTASPAWAALAKQPTIVAEKKTTTTHSWDQLVKWIKQDPETSPAGGLGKLRDPFRVPEKKVAKTETDDEDQAEAAAEPQPEQVEATPEELGLVLSSTVIGSRRRAALINGRTYALGQTIEIDKDEQRIAFTLLDVHTWKVVLERLGKRFDWTISRPASSGRLELIGSRN